MMFPKPKVWINKKYIDNYIRTLPCACGEPAPSQPHHTEGRKRDDMAVPVCYSCHELIHRTGKYAGDRRRNPLTGEKFDPMKYFNEWRK